MLDENPRRDEEGQKPEQTRTGDKVTCFVCKKAVDPATTRQVNHAREKQVPVCESHIK